MVNAAIMKVPSIPRLKLSHGDSIAATICTVRRYMPIFLQPHFFSTAAAVELRCDGPGTATQSSSSLVDDFTRFCYQRDLHMAMETLNYMQINRVWADCVTYSELIKCCLSRGTIKHGKIIHNHIFSHGHRPKTFLTNVLLDMFVKFGRLQDAHNLFDEMSERNVVSWTTLISAYVKSGYKAKAMELLILMMKEGVKPNMYTYSTVFRACHGLTDLIQLHCCVIKDGLHFDPFIRSALIDIYSKWGELDKSIRIFNEVSSKDPVVWNSIIGGLAQNTDGDGALNFFKKMKGFGLEPDQPSLTSVLRACTGLALLELGRQVHVHVLKFEQDLILNNALIDMYCKCGSLEESSAVFTKMIEKDVISWSTMIIGLGQNGFSQEALKMFESMKASGIKPNYITLVGVLFACSHAGLVEDGLSYFYSMKNVYGIDQGREHYGCVVDLLGRAGRFDEAIKLIHDMKCEPDVVTWRTLLGACRVHNNRDIAIYAAKQILNLQPDDAGAYILLSNIYANSERWKDVAQVRKDMNIHGIRKEPGCSWIEVNRKIHAFILGDRSHPQIGDITTELKILIWKLKEKGYVPDTNFTLQDLEGEQKEDAVLFHSEKLAIVFGMMNLPKESVIRIRKNLRTCGDCHNFAKILSAMDNRNIVLRDPIRYHHFKNGSCSCADYW